MKRGRLVAIAASLSLSLALAATAGATEEPDHEYARLAGTFGKVIGTDPASPATAAPDGRPLATWMRSETLELALDPPLDDATSVSLVATAVDGGEGVELPVDEGRWVTGPDTPGLHVVVATITRGQAPPTEHAWLLDVGDRPGSWETLLQRPAVEASLVAASGAVTGERGHGCLTDFCQEVGYRPPPDTLEPLTVKVGEPLSLELDDGSAMVHWEGRVEPVAGNSKARFAEATFDQPLAAPLLAGLEPDAAGEWLLEVRADYDRERGWQWYLFRLVAE